MVADDALPIYVLHLVFRSGSVPALHIPSFDRRALNWRKQAITLTAGLLVKWQIGIAHV